MAMEQIEHATSNTLTELKVPAPQNGIKNIFITYFWDKMWASLH